MRFLACCTTRSRRFLLGACFTALLCCSGLVSTARADQPAKASPNPELTQLVQRNSLRGEGKKPFHLRMKFQVFDLAGAPSETGTLDEWWAGPGGFHLDIAAPSVGTVHDLATEKLPNDEAKRTLYLAGRLLQAAIAPGDVAAAGADETVSEESNRGNLVLHCIRATKVRPGGPSFVVGTVCADQTGSIRITKTGEDMLVRNKIGVFAGTRVALTEEVSYGEHMTISGTVETLQSFDPAHAPVELQKPQTAPSVARQNAVRLPGGVLAGKILHNETPVYPETARQQRMSGTVLLLAEISDTGKVESLVPVASPNRLFAAAAMDAVKKWTYTPYLLNGQPVRVDTTITVNFNMN